MLNRRKEKPFYSEEEATRWLSWLAHGMQKQGQTVFLIEQLQPSWLKAGWETWSYLLSTRLIGSLLALIAVHVSWGLFSSVPLVVIPLVLGTWIGVSFGVISGWRWRRAHQKGSSRMSYRLFRFIFGALGMALFTAIILWILMNRVEGLAAAIFVVLAPVFLGPYLWLRFRRRPNADIGMVEALGFSWLSAVRGAGKWLLLVLAVALPSPFLGFFAEALILAALTVAPPAIVLGATFDGLQPRVLTMKELPLQGIRLSLRNAALAAASVGLAVGLTISIESIFFPGEFLRDLSPWAAFFLGASPALIAALWFGVLDVIDHYLLRFIVTRKGYLPPHLVDFLDHAADELRFLQKVGGGYMFIHRSLLEYFAGLGEEMEGVDVGADSEVGRLAAAGKSS